MTYFDEAVETMDRESLHGLQLDKLRKMLAQLLGRNRFYTAKLEASGAEPEDIRSLSDLARLPLTTKDELLRDQAANPPFGTNTTFHEKAYTRIHQTSGTTGRPLFVLDTQESWAWWGKCWAFVFAGAGLDAGDRIFIPFSFGPFIGFWAAVEGAREIGALMIPGGGRDTRQRLEIIRELRATAICCTPTYALHLAEVAREVGVNLGDTAVRATIHAGEPGANIKNTKARIEAAFNAKCFDHAGASEVGAHSFECEVQPGGTHAIESEFIVEALDPQTQAPVQPGAEGELVITNLGRNGFPVIRYRTGDLVRLNHEHCECGRTFTRFEGGVLGRTDDMVVVRGVNVFPAGVENLIRQFREVDEFRVTVLRRNEMYRLEVEIEIADGADPETSRGGIQKAILDALFLRPSVTVVPRGTLPRFELKARRFHVVH